MGFLESNGIWIYLFIFFGKIIEVTTSTVRIVLINRGERTKGTILALIEALLWIIVTGTVLQGFTQDFVKAILYCIAFALGNYIGSWVENKIALGMSTIQVITAKEECNRIIDVMRRNNLGVTEVDAMGREGERKILYVHLKRNRVNEAIDLINSINPNSVITISDLKIIKGGFIRKLKK